MEVELTEDMFDVWDHEIEVRKRQSSDPFLAATARLPEFMTPDQAAEALGMSTQTIRRRVADGSLPYIRLGRLIRIPTSALRRLFAYPDQQDWAA